MYRWEIESGKIKSSPSFRYVLEDSVSFSLSLRLLFQSFVSLTHLNSPLSCVSFILITFSCSVSITRLLSSRVFRREVTFVFQHFPVSIILFLSLFASFLYSPFTYTHFCSVVLLIMCVWNPCLTSDYVVLILHFRFANVRLNFCAHISLLNTISVNISAARGYHVSSSHIHTRIHTLLAWGGQEVTGSHGKPTGSEKSTPFVRHIKTCACLRRKTERGRDDMDDSLRYG